MDPDQNEKSETTKFISDQDNAMSLNPNKDNFNVTGTIPKKTE